MNPYRKIILSVLVSSIILALSLFLTLRPGTVSEFSVKDGFSHVESIAQKPHSIGSQENKKVREYIVKELESMGLNPEIQEAQVFFGYNQLAKVYNIAALVKGTDPTGTIAAVAHYDTVMQAPGASDDTAGVAAILESIKKLFEDGPVRNNILILITDGEEIGLAGMKAFMDEHPYAEDIKFIINLEARGTSGPSLMFETTYGNYNTMKEYKKAGPRVISTSIMTTLYNMMPNLTDYTIAKNSGIQGLNFAFIGKGYNYHKLGDNFENFEKPSFAHIGDNLLLSLKHFSKIDLNTLYSSGEGVFFNIFNFIFILYPQDLVIPILVLVILLSILVLWKGFSKKAFKLSEVLISIGFQIALCAFLFFLFPLLQKSVKYINTDMYIKLWAYNYNSMILFLAMTFLTLFLVFSVLAFYTRKFDKSAILPSSLILWSLLAVFVSIYFPGASYIPILLTLAHTIVIFLLTTKHHNTRESYGLYEIIPFITAITVIFPLLFFVLEAFTLVGFQLVSIILVLVFIPFCSGILSFKKTALISIVVTFILTISFFAAEAFTSNVNISKELQYIYTSDYTVAEYSVDNTMEEELTNWFIYGIDSELTGINVDTPISDTPFPNVTIISDEVNNNGRIVKIKIDPSSPSSRLVLSIDNEKQHITDILLNGQYEIIKDDILQMSFFGMENVTADIHCSKDSDFEIILAETLMGFDEIHSKEIHDLLSSYKKILPVLYTVTKTNISEK